MRALAPVPAGLLLAVHLAQLRARVVAAAGCRAAGVGGEDDAVARLGQLEELGVVVRELRALDGVRAALLAGGQGQVPLLGVDQLGGELRRGAARARGSGSRGGCGGGGGRRLGVVVGVVVGLLLLREPPALLVRLADGLGQRAGVEHRRLVVESSLESSSESSESSSSASSSVLVGGQADRGEVVGRGVAGERDLVHRDGRTGHGQRTADDGGDGDTPAHRGGTGQHVRALFDQRVPGGPLREGVAHVTASGERMPSHVPAFRSHGPVGRPASGFAGRVGSPAVRFRDRPVLASRRNLAAGSRRVACVPARWTPGATSGGTLGVARVGRRRAGRRAVGAWRRGVTPVRPGRCSSGEPDRRRPGRARPS